MLIPEGQLWPFLHMRNSKLGKNSRSELGTGRGPFAKTLCREENNFANKVVEERATK